MAPVRRTQAQRREQSRRNLMETLERLLTTEAYADLTIDRILAEAEVSRSTFYAYFPDKATLLLAVGVELFGDALDVADPWWQLDATATPDDLRRALADIVDLYRRHVHTIRALVDAAGFEPIVRERFGGMQDGAIAKLAAHIRRGQRAGFARAGLDPRRSAGWVVWMIERGLHELVAGAGPREAARQLDALTDLIWFAVYDT